MVNDSTKTVDVLPYHDILWTISETEHYSSAAILSFSYLSYLSSEENWRIGDLNAKQHARHNSVFKEASNKVVKAHQPS